MDEIGGKQSCIYCGKGIMRKQGIVLCCICGDEFTKDSLNEMKEWGEEFYSDGEVMICPDCYDNFMLKDPEEQVLDMIHYGFSINIEADKRYKGKRTRIRENLDSET